MDDEVGSAVPNTMAATAAQAPVKSVATGWYMSVDMALGYTPVAPDAIIVFGAAWPSRVEVAPLQAGCPTPSLFVKWRGQRAAGRQPRHRSCEVDREGVELHAGSPTPSAATFMVELAPSRQRRPCRRWQQALRRAP
jgi:hypothetical protein